MSEKKTWRGLMKRIKIFILLLVSALCFAEQNQEEPTCLPPAQLSLSHHFGRGVGHKGYSSAEAFFIRGNNDQFSPFIDLRLHVMNDGRIASNAGVGFRTFPWDKISIGGNIYYDYRNSSHLHTHQVAGGFELLSEYLDFRLNGYLPVGGKKRSKALVFEGFSGNQIDVKRKTYYAYPVINGEFGVPLPWISPKYTDFYIAVGPYYLFGETVSDNHYEGSFGFKGRFTALITDYVELGFEYNYDRVYHSTYQGIVAVHIPLYKNSACRSKGGSNKGQKAFAKRTLRPVIRNEIIPVKKKSVVRPLKDGNGNVFQAFFVNNLASCPGFGTFENPFCSLALAEGAATPGSLIYVFEGDGTTANYHTGFTLQEGQTLQGSGTPFSFGGISIPAQTAGSPSITSGTDGVILANNTTVRGLNIVNPGQYGIFGTSVDNVLIESNTISNPGVHGVEIANHGGTLTVRNNVISGAAQNGISIETSTFPGRVYVIGNTIINHTADGVLVRTNHPDAYVLISGNTFSRNFNPGALIGSIGTEIRQGFVEIINNTINTDSLWSLHGLDGTHLFANNVVNGISGVGSGVVSFETTALAIDPGHVTISNNQISVQGAGLYGILVTSATPGVNFFTNINGNQVTTSDPTAGILVSASNGNTGCAVLTNNTASTFDIQGLGASAINMQQTQAAYNSANTAIIGFSEAGTVNFGTGCTGP